MKTPDKIYLYGDSVHNEPTKDWGIVPKNGKYRGYPILSKEYIRKDVLLEWLKESGYEEEDRISVATIINKINSL